MSNENLAIMTRSEEAEWWFNAVYEAVQEIPSGYVTSYGHIAMLLGRREILSSMKILLTLKAERARFVTNFESHLMHLGKLGFA